MGEEAGGGGMSWTGTMGESPAPSLPLSCLPGHWEVTGALHALLPGGPVPPQAKHHV